MVTAYTPLKIAGNSTGLVQEREEFLLPDDAYPTLQNAYVWRERIKRKQGCRILGRLRRVLTAQPLGLTVGGTLSYTFADIFTTLGITGEPNAQIAQLVITIGAPDNATFTDNGLGGFTVTGAGVALGSSINYITGAVTIVISASIGGAAITATMSYYPALPVMGLRLRELNNNNNDQTIAFDTKYAYQFVGTGWQEFIPGTTWTGTNSDFFWTTNYWVTPPPANAKLFWVTNDSGPAGDPIRYTNGTAWVNFAPTINAAGDVLAQCLAMVPFRGRMVTFNTLEGPSLATSVRYFQRIRWAAIGNPISDISPLFPLVGNISVDAWRDDIRGKGGFLDIPTSENIVAVGFVRDNLVIYCERSTWQLRYTGRSIAPFQIEKVNSELGAESTYSAVQFDTSLVGIGDKGIVECDSYKSELIDIKIPDLVLTQFNNTNNGPKRVYGIRNFIQRLAYWVYPDSNSNGVFPDRRLIYNYENDSWAIYIDSFTCFGTFQPTSSRTWANTPKPWQQCNFSWQNQPALIPAIIAGNQQGYTAYTDSQTVNDPMFSITAILGATPNVTTVTSPAHNMQSGYIIKISGIPTGTGYASLNGGIFYAQVIDADTFQIWKYNPLTDAWDIPAHI